MNIDISIQKENYLGRRSSCRLQHLLDSTEATLTMIVDSAADSDFDLLPDDVLEEIGWRASGWSLDLLFWRLRVHCECWVSVGELRLRVK